MGINEQLLVLKLDGRCHLIVQPSVLLSSLWVLAITFPSKTFVIFFLMFLAVNQELGPISSVPGSIFLRPLRTNKKANSVPVCIRCVREKIKQHGVPERIYVGSILQNRAALMPDSIWVWFLGNKTHSQCLTIFLLVSFEKTKQQNQSVPDCIDVASWTKKPHNQCLAVSFCVVIWKTSGNKIWRYKCGTYLGKQSSAKCLTLFV